MLAEAVENENDVTKEVFPDAAELKNIDKSQRISLP